MIPTMWHSGKRKHEEDSKEISGLWGLGGWQGKERGELGTESAPRVNVLYDAMIAVYVIVQLSKPIECTKQEWASVQTKDWVTTMCQWELLGCNNCATGRAEWEQQRIDNGRGGAAVGAAGA